VACEGAYADLALNAALERSQLSNCDRGLATELVYGTLRHRGLIDYILSALTKRPLRKVSPPVLASLRLGLYQLLHTRVPPRAAVNESVALVQRDHPHAAGFVNAVLRKAATLQEQEQLPDPIALVSDPVEAYAITTSHPRWLLEEVQAQRGGEAMHAWVEANNRRPQLSLRVRQGVKRAQVAETLGELGEVTVPERFPDGLLLKGGRPTELPGFAEGVISVQDLAAQLVGRLAAPAPDWFVLDSCAAPGGKALHMAELMDDRGTVLAVDIHRAKTRLIQQAAERLGLSSIQPAAADASDLDALEDLLADRGRADVDCVVIDAPCTGMGTLRRNPELRARPEASMAELVRAQDALLDAGARVLASGGVLVYAVCTPTRAEGPERIRALLDRNSQLTLDVVTDPVLNPFLETCKEIAEDACVVRTWSDLHGCDSFFMARIKKA
jgi:16S rRNA (cytosine967-C5)-methyltransferase